MSPRMPSEDDRRLWHSVTGDIAPLKGRALPDTPVEVTEAAEETKKPAPRQQARPLPPLPPEPPSTPSLDRNTAKRLKSGKIRPDAKVDLHGLTLDEANSRVHATVAQALERGHRLLLVVTGRGGKKLASAEQGTGRIRASLETWIRNGPHRHRVVDIRQAHVSHGGEGAYYVYLKKNRVEGARGFEPRTR